MRADDAVGRAELWRESGRFFAALDSTTAHEPDAEGLTEWLDGIRQRHARNPTVLMLVAEIDGQVVGQVMARLFEPEASARWQVMRDLEYEHRMGYSRHEVVFRKVLS